MRIDLLDHGYLEFIEAWGRGKAGTSWYDENDNRRVDGPVEDFEVGIIEAARQSTQGSFRGWERDEKLLAFLVEHKHDSPFEFAGMTIEVQAPIVVFREWHRHRTQSYNEMSGRYTELPNFDYLPSAQRLMAPTDGPNKQASRKEGTPALDEEGAIATRMEMAALGRDAERCYQIWLSRGVPKELARLRLPIGRYSRMRATGNLRNWLAFLTLRMHPDAQWEIRQYANTLGEQVISKYFPHTWDLFEKPGITPTCVHTLVAESSTRDYATSCGKSIEVLRYPGIRVYPFCPFCGKQVEEKV